MKSTPVRRQLRLGAIAIALTVGAQLSLSAQAAFLRGDVDGSGGLSPSDAIALLSYLFRGEEEAVPCRDAGDSDDDGHIRVTDAVHLVQALYGRGPVPPEPYPFCGSDPTPDALDCGETDFCLPGQRFIFYGVSQKADGIFFLVDRSGWMAGSGELMIARREISRALVGLSDGVSFGIVFSDEGVLAYPSDGKPAVLSAATRAEALGFLNGIPGGEGACIGQGLEAALAMGLDSTAERRVLVFLGTGGGSCEGVDRPEYLEETLRQVTELNDGRVHVQTMGVLVEDPLGEDFLRELAERNGGSYVRRDR